MWAERVVFLSRRRRGWVLAGAAALLLLSLAGLQRVRFDPDVLSLLPRDGRSIPAFRNYLEQFGSLDDLYLVFAAPPGQTITDYAGQIDAWIEALRAAPEITRVDGGTAAGERDWAWLADRQLLLLDGQELEEALSRLRPDGMPRALAESREMLALPSPEVAALVQQDPLGLLGVLQRRFGSLQTPSTLAVSPDGYLTADRRERLVIARPREGPFDTEFAHALLDRVEAVQQQVAAAAASRRTDGEEEAELPPMAVEVLGGHRIAVEAEAVVRRESIVNGVGSLALILPLLYLVFRSLWLVLVGGLPSMLSLLAVLAAIGWSGATLSAASAGASAMLFGLGVDGVVLLYVTHRLAQHRSSTADAEQLESGELATASAPVGSDRQISRALGAPAVSMLLGMWTTAATFLGLVVVDFPSLEQLGLVIGLSMALCGLLTLTMIPATLPARAGRTRALTMPRLAEWIVTRRTPVLVAAAIVTAGAAVAASALRVNPTLERLRSVTPGALALEDMTARFGLPADVSLVVAAGPELEPLLVENAAFVETVQAADPAIALQAPSLLLPSQEAQRARAERVRTSLPPAPVLTAFFARASVEAGFRENAFEPFSARLPMLVSSHDAVSIEGLQTHGFDDLTARFVARTATGWMLVTYAFPRDPGQLATLQRIVEQGPETMQLTGLPAVNAELAARFAPQFVRGLAVGTVAVLVMLLVTFREWRLSLLALVPTLVGLVWAAGCLALAQVELDLFAVFAVITFVGIGVDYGVHLVHRFNERGDARRAVAELSPVILVAGAITFLGYGTLIGSSYPPLRSMGLVSAVSVVALVAASLFVLPCLLPVRRAS